MIKKILLGILGLVLVMIIGVFVFVNTSYDKDYSSEYPIPDIKVTADSARIARGEYLVNGPAHCVDCHSPAEAVAKGEVTADVALSGGFGLEIPPGKFYAPNITPDKETGIGRYSDGQLYRMLRHNIRPNGHVTVDFMPFIHMADDDIYAIIAYLRNLKPVKNQMPETELSFLGKMVFAMGGVKPGVPKKPVLDRVQPDSTAAYGEYLAYSVANCMGCHTERDMKTGEFIGEPYAGGLIFGPDDLTRGWVFHTPNLTPDQQTGHMAGWDEEFFIERMRGGKVYDTTPMPWSAYAKMTDQDLKAIYRYLKTVQPVAKTISDIAVPPQKGS